MILIAIAAFLLLAAAALFAIIKAKDKNTNNDTVISESSEIPIGTTTASTSITQTTTAEITTETATTTTKDPHEFTGVINTKNDNLSVRAAPSYDSEILGTIPKGTEIRAFYLDNNKDWFKVQYEDNLEGYSCSHYILNKEKPDEVVPHEWMDATMTKPKTCKVCGATEGEPLYGTGWVDNLDVDLDGDGMNEHIEVYEDYSVLNDVIIQYRVYDNDSFFDYEKVFIDHSSMTEFCDAIIYDGNTGRYYACSIGGRSAGAYSYQVIRLMGAEDSYLRAGYDTDYDPSTGIVNKVYYYKLNGNDITRDEFISYVRNISLVYSLVDPSGDILNWLKNPPV